MSKRRKGGPTPPKQWQPMRRATPANPDLFVEHEGPAAEMWANDRYTVVVAPPDGTSATTLDRDGALWLSIRRNDRRALRDWRDFQRIKNDLAGPEREAFELFPAESRLVDTANQYHLWVLPAGQRLPVGWDMGRVLADGDGNLTRDGEPVDLEEHAGSAAAQVVAHAVQRPGADQ